MFILRFLWEHKFVLIIVSTFWNRDAEDAVHARDGYDYDGYRLRVEFPRGSQSGGGGSHRYLHFISYSIWQVIFLVKIAGLFAMLVWHLKATFLKCTIYLLLGAVVGVEAEVVVDEVEKVAVMEAAITAALLQEEQTTELSSLVSRRHNFI